MPNLYRRSGAEILVNTETGSGQLAQHVAALPGGGFIVVWSDTSGVGGDTPDSGIKVQRFDAGGNKVGGEILANTEIDGFQVASEVAALDNGRFVVTWSSQIGPEGDDPGSGIKGQVFNADGTKSGGEFFVSISTPDLQFQPSITALANGNFVVSWTDLSGLGGDADGGIKMRIFNSTGAPVSGELLANTATEGTQTSPAMTALASGGFAAVWAGANKIAFQQFDSAGAKVGAERQINTLPGGATPDIAALGFGFVVTWSHRDNALDPDGYEVFARVFGANGLAFSDEFQVNTTMAGDQTVARVVPLPGGHFLVVWQGPGSGGADMDVHGQVFSGNGIRVGVEFVVNGIAADAQTVPEIVVLPSGDIVATWTDASGIGGDASGTGVKMQLLTLATDPPTDIALSNATVSETAVANTAVATLTAAGALNTSFTYEIVSDSSGGAFRIDGDRLVVDDNNLLDFETRPALDLRIRVTDLNGNSYEETMAITVADAAIERRYSAGGEFIVPVATAGLQGEPMITLLEGGRFLVRWSSISSPGLQGRIFEADGEPAGGEFTLTDYAFGADYPAVALPGGGFVMIWSGKTVGGDSSLVGQVFNAAGGTAGAKFAIDPTGIGEQIDVALIDSSHFVVSYGSLVQDDPGDPSPFGRQIRAQIFDLSGAEVGADFRVNTAVEGFQTSARIDSLPGGGFVAIWEDKGTEGIKAQLFNAAGVKVGGEIAILAGVVALGGLDIAALASGGFVATWGQLVDEGEPTEHVELFGQLVGANGVAIGSPFFVDAVLSNYGALTVVEGMPDGGFVIAWNAISLFGDGDGDAVIAQLYDAAAVRVGDPFVVNAVTREDQLSHGLAVAPAGELIFTWSDIFHPPGNVDADIKARILTLTPEPGLPTENADALYGTPGDNVIHALGGNDIVNGFAGNDSINGGGGADKLSGGDGNDSIDGGAGDDVLRGGGGNDSLVELGGEDDQLFGGGGDDRLTYQHMVSGVRHAMLDGGTGDDILEARVTNNDFVTLVGGSGRDRITATSGYAITIDAGADADLVQVDLFVTVIEVTLGGGADLLVLGDTFFPVGSLFITDFVAGDAGDGLNLADYLVGGVVPVTDPFASGHLILFQSGADTVLGLDPDGTGGLVSTQLVITFENVSVSSLTAHNLGGYSPDGSPVPGISLSGSAGFDFLTGYSGNDRIVGNGGNDVLYGGGGNDRIEGSEGIDELHGQLGNDELLGGGGNDRLDGGRGRGNDFLDGGAGSDVMAGGFGSDVYLVDNGADVVIELVGDGTDKVYALTSYVLTAGSEIETLTVSDHGATTAINLFGNEFSNNIYGNNGVNVLNGGGGNDAMVGYGGNDIFVIDNAADIAIEYAGQGVDTVYTTTSYALNGGSEIETLTVTDHGLTTAINLTGNEYSNNLYGNNGVNALNGGGGNDAMVGYGGNDIFIVDNAADIAIEYAGQGIDTVYTTTSYTLNGGSEIETLTVSDHSLTNAINLTGNAYNNNIYGNNGANVLNGGGGNDAMIGYGGNDTFLVDSAADVAFEYAGQGVDTVYTTVTYTLNGGSEIERLSVNNHGATTAISLTGNTFNNEVLGNNGVNTLNGGGGNDTLAGFGGADIFAFTTTPGAGNVDLIADFLSGTDKIALENAVFTGLPAGPLAAGAFHTGAAAHDPDDRIIYNSATGALYFDADGNGSGAQVQFATLFGLPSLVAGDFTVI